VGGQEPHAALAEAYRRCANAVEDWLLAREEERAATSKLQEAERTASDLEYQIRELRAALEKHELAIEADHTKSEKRIIEANQEIEHVEGALLQLASRFCEPLRAKPELGPLFQELESEAAA
jgi:serine/threonine-protein kinase